MEKCGLGCHPTVYFAADEKIVLPLVPCLALSLPCLAVSSALAGEEKRGIERSIEVCMWWGVKQVDGLMDGRTDDREDGVDGRFQCCTYNEPLGQLIRQLVLNLPQACPK